MIVVLLTSNLAIRQQENLRAENNETSKNIHATFVRNVYPDIYLDSSFNVNVKTHVNMLKYYPFYYVIVQKNP